MRTPLLSILKSTKLFGSHHIAGISEASGSFDAFFDKYYVLSLYPGGKGHHGHLFHNTRPKLLGLIDSIYYSLVAGAYLGTYLNWQNTFFSRKLLFIGRFA